MVDRSFLRRQATSSPGALTSRIDTRDVAVPRKVLFVESGRGYGGSAFSLFRLVKSLDRSRYEPHVVAFHNAQVFEEIRLLGVPVKIIREFRPLFVPSPVDRTLWTKARNYCSTYGNLGADILYNGIRLAHYIQRNQVDLVHLNNGISENLSAAFATRLVKVPCVSHERGAEAPRKMEKYLVDWVSAVITLNRASLDQYAAVFGREKVRIIFNGVDLDTFEKPNPQKIQQEFDIEPGTFAVATFARLVEGKGVPEFIATAARVRREYGHSRFFVVGHDPTKGQAFEARMRQLSGELGLGGQLVFTGWRNDCIDIMAAMDLVLQISTTFPEGMSLAPLEAMALGKPVIVTKIPGYEFCVDDGKTGFVVEPGDIQALTDKVLRLARDKDFALRMGQEGKRKAVLQFDIRLTARQVQGVYDQVLSIARAS